MKIRIPNYYKEFHCVAGSCPDTCCAAWEVVLDDAACAAYETVPGPLGERIRSAIREQDGERCFTMKQGRCTLLDDDGLCSIQKHLGETMLCRVCDFYPRFSTEIGLHRELGLSLSCPEAARLILTNPEPVVFLEYETDEGVSIPHDVDATLYLQLIAARRTAFHLLQDRSRSIPDRACLLLDFAGKLQPLLTMRRYRSMESVTKKYQDPKFLFHRLHTLHRNQRSASQCAHLAQAQFYTFRQMEHLSNQWEKQLTYYAWQLSSLFESEEHLDLLEEFEAHEREYDYQYEQLLVYFVYKYMLRAAFDHQLEWRLKLAAVSYWIIREISLVNWLQGNRSFTDLDQLDLVHQFSKELEHSEENMHMLAEQLSHKHHFELRELYALLLA